MPFWPLCREGEANLFKKFCPKLLGLECSYGKISIPVTEISVAKTDIGNRASPACYTTTSTFLRRNGWRGEISETKPARAVDRAGSYEETLNNT